MCVAAGELRGREIRRFQEEKESKEEESSEEKAPFQSIFGKVSISASSRFHFFSSSLSLEDFNSISMPIFDSSLRFLAQCECF